MDVNWNVIAGQVMTEALRILIPVLTVLVLKWIVEIYWKLKEKHPEIAELIAYAAQLGYAAAEEYFRNLEVSGDDKMAYAIKRAIDYLKTVGVNANEEVIRDSINQYGVSNYRFSWTKSPLAAMFEEMKTEPDEEDPEGKEEEDHEPVDADDHSVGCDHNDHDGDHNEACEPAVRPCEGLAGEEDRERTADDDQDGQAGRPDSPDGEEAA